MITDYFSLYSGLRITANYLDINEFEMEKEINMKPICIAYYLGQYHPLEENNLYWGDGFTEWHNVSKARPLFPGHIQPQLPGALGFYDLRCEETLLSQMDYAKEIGVDAFCYWHYWFGGKRVLHEPLDKIISLPDRGVKVMLGWANESWTGIWHGLSDQVIFKQTYDNEELDAHAKLIAGYLNSDKYLRVGHLSPFLIYKPRLIPDAKKYLTELREKVRTYGGGDLYIIGSWGPGKSERINNPSEYGLDAVVANNVGKFFKSSISSNAYLGLWKLAKKCGLGPEVRNYKSTIDTLISSYKEINGVVHATIVAGWDNTPRSGRRGLVLKGYNETSFREAITTAVQYENKNSRKILFIKSWNEWAEGNTIEPKFHENWSAGQVLQTELKDKYEQ
ncbi:glycoside hydrolase family 99-like domain-containing protein [Undibacterium sp. RuRC25W]|uniref:glycosyltransferase WbsX family protein n=1 Tax=Undibacterium sp. RuRC25W TaxID=3413047 RepID=UPI003BF41E0B